MPARRQCVCIAATTAVREDHGNKWWLTGRRWKGIHICNGYQHVLLKVTATESSCCEYRNQCWYWQSEAFLFWLPLPQYATVWGRLHWHVTQQQVQHFSPIRRRTSRRKLVRWRSNKQDFDWLSGFFVQGLRGLKNPAIVTTYHWYKGNGHLCDYLLWDRQLIWQCHMARLGRYEWWWWRRGYRVQLKRQPGYSATAEASICRLPIGEPWLGSATRYRCRSLERQQLASGIRENRGGRDRATGRGHTTATNSPNSPSCLCLNNIYCGEER